MTRNKKTVGLVKKQQRAGYVFVLPIIIGLVLIFAPVMFQTVFFSFNQVKMGANGYFTVPIQFSNYVKLFTQDTWFVQNTISSVKSVITDFICVLIFSFFIATILNHKFKGRTFARVIFFLPVVLSTGIISKLESGDLLMSLMQQSNGASTGIINSMAGMDLTQFLMSTAFSPALINFVIAAISNIYNIVVSSGVQILIFTAGLQSISPQLYEAAHVEGCSGWEAFWKITLPMISPLILVNGIYTIIDSCTKPTNTIMAQVLSQTILANYSYASAMAIVYLILIALVMGILYLISKRYIFYQD